MSLKINPIVATIIIAGILILCFAVFKGCKRSRIEVAAKEKAIKIADSVISELKRFKSESDSSKADFDIQKELLSGQIDLLDNKLNKRGEELDKALMENKELIAKHKLAMYKDTATVMVPAEFVQDCENCFSNLQTTTTLSSKYKSDLNNFQKKLDEQNAIYQKRFKQLDAEKLGFYNKMQSFAAQAKEATDKLKPHGRLYLSWGVLWSPWPVGAGGGLMYQTKYNFQYGLKAYYGKGGTTVETSMHFPLSIKF